MTGAEFKTARMACLKVSQAELGIMMDGTSKRTIQEVEAMGDVKIRGVYSAVMRLLIERDTYVMQKAIGRAVDQMDRDFPAGIRFD